MISFEPLRVLMVKRNMNYTDLAELIGSSLPTVYRLKRDESTSIDVIDKLCSALDVRIEEVIEHKKDAAQG